MSAHEQCHAVGKFDCLHDEYIHAVTLDQGGGEGDVESPVAWFDRVDLEVDCEGHEPGPYQPAGVSVYCEGSCTREWGHSVHYGTRWLLARENSQGRFWVECYDTEQARDGRYDELVAAFLEWEGPVL